jgi:8-oxo-dGTP pyrophosphatase MutT (NUDIX family)
MSQLPAMSVKPDLTVASVIERNGQYLLVEERVGSNLVFNQPAGHVERGERFIDAAIRETLEETAWLFQPEALVGVYFWEQPEKHRSFLRFTFCGTALSHDPARRLDRGIERALWLSREEIVARTARLRSPMVLRCIDDYLEGRRYSMELVSEYLRDATSQQIVDRRPTSVSGPAAADNPS